MPLPAAPLARVQARALRNLRTLPKRMLPLRLTVIKSFLRGRLAPAAAGATAAPAAPPAGPSAFVDAPVRPGTGGWAALASLLPCS